jgi:hypothetical protein
MNRTPAGVHTGGVESWRVRLPGALLLIVTLAVPDPATAGPLGPSCPSKVMVFYYPWYGGASHDWRHWANATGEPQYQYAPPDTISSADYPSLGPYDSQDPAVIDQHLAWAADAGIDALISSWWGPGEFEDVALGTLLDEIETTGSPVRASIYFETWAVWYGHGLNAAYFTDPRNFTPDSRELIRQQTASWLSYVVSTYGDRPGFLHTTEGRPVIFVYSVGTFEPAEWQDIFARVRAATGRDAFFQGDVEGVDFQAQGQAFDGLHLYTPVHLTAEGDLSLVARIRDPHAAVRNPLSWLTDPVTVGADYQAWAAEARALGKGWAATVIPGFDDRKVRNPSFVVSRDHGVERTYDWFWRQALATRPDWVLITTFNEWHEGSEIEPSLEYGDEFLLRTRLWADRVHACPPS